MMNNREILLTIKFFNLPKVFPLKVFFRFHGIRHFKMSRKRPSAVSGMLIHCRAYKHGTTMGL